MNPHYPNLFLFLAKQNHHRSWDALCWTAIAILGSTVFIGVVKIAWLCKLCTNLMTFLWIKHTAILRLSSDLSTPSHDRDVLGVLSTHILLLALAICPIAALSVTLPLYVYKQPSALVFYLLTFMSNAGAFVCIQWLLPRAPAYVKQGLVQGLDLIFCILAFHWVARIPLAVLYLSESFNSRLAITSIFMLMQFLYRPGLLDYSHKVRHALSHA